MKNYLDLQFEDIGNWAENFYNEWPENDRDEPAQVEIHEDSPS